MKPLRLFHKDITFQISMKKGVQDIQLTTVPISRNGNRQDNRMVASLMKSLGHKTHFVALNRSIRRMLNPEDSLTTHCVLNSRARNVISDTVGYQAINCRRHSAVLTDFGGVGDGKTSNTIAFQSAIANLSKYASDGGAQLVVPPGKWLTGSFNLTSHFTLFLHKDAVLLASQDEAEWPVLPPLPSYGRGRDAPGGRYSSLIFGTNLTDVVITGNNGTIDGQGATWWDKLHKGLLNLTRPYLIEILYSRLIQISNLTLINSPSWNVHPTYSSYVLVQGLTILAPIDSPNTDGINPGNNGTIDGQGAPWWDKYKQGLLKATRPFLIELLYTNQLQISNITLTNSPSWHVHPIYCSNVVIQEVTILAPVEVPNTDGINPDKVAVLLLLRLGPSCSFLLRASVLV
ncbi:hypothetical protein GH714_028673 [Hevea brasiliensis]|uniref:Pectate lyase superfamily protein domain-containing protein n=1 Tax=Hevea brasiliensis TaxID=3981 RepID=A0A6A6MG28_HEVBR|nr:hypothetical protein GH714_028673 [Hevea brasiliensis]